jgi:hypothetical protein
MLGGCSRSRIPNELGITGRATQPTADQAEPSPWIAATRELTMMIRKYKGDQDQAGVQVVVPSARGNQKCGPREVRSALSIIASGRPGCPPQPGVRAESACVQIIGRRGLRAGFGRLSLSA